MDSYSILDNSPSQAGPEIAPLNLASLDPISVDQKSALPPVRETLRFPGEDGGKSLSEMAQRDLDATLQLLAERAQYITGASGAAIALRQGDTMVCCASSGSSAPELGAHLQIDSGLSGESVRTRQVLQCDDAENDPRVNRDSCRAFGIASVVVMPLIRGEEVYGVFELLSSRPRAFEERDFIALNRLAEMIQTAVEHSDAAHRAEKELSQPAVGLNSASITSTPPITRQTGSPKVEAHLSGDVLDEDSVEPPRSSDILVVATEAPAVIAAPVAVAALVEGSELANVSQEELGATGEPSSIGTIAFGNLGKCATCGFPVSEGRKLCLDCEAASPDAVSNGPDIPGGFGEEPNSWVRSHMYLIGAAIITVATIALLAWRL